MQGQLTPSFGDYELIDTGDFEKLERFGQYVARRPEPQAIWRRSLDPTYITTYNNARSLIRRIDRDELLQILVKSYLGE